MEYPKFVKEENKLLERLPLEFRSAVLGLACGLAKKENAETHLLYLTTIVKALEEPIAEFEKDLLQEYCN